MTASFSARLKQFATIRNFKFDQRVLIFLIFLLLSTLFWFLNALSKEYTTTIECPVKYNYPKSKILYGKHPPEKYSLKVTSFGYVLLRYNFFKTPIILDLATLPLIEVRGSDSTMFYLQTNQAKERISENLNAAIKVQKIIPDSIFFQFAKVVQKKVKIFPDLILRFDKQYMLQDSIKIEPDSVLIYGPKQLIADLDSISTQQYEFKKLNKTITANLLVDSIHLVTFSEKNIKVTIPVERFTEAKFQFKIDVIGSPPNTRIKTFPNIVTLTCNVGLSQYEKIDAKQFKVAVTYKKSNEQNDNKLKVELIEAPDFIKPGSIQLNPTRVEYIIERIGE